MANPVIVSDLEERFRPLVGQEVTNAQGLLEDAWEYLLIKIPDLETRLTSGELRPGAVRFVMRETIIPVLRNPDGVQTWRVDDYSQTRDKSVSSGRVVVDPELVDLLRSGGGLGAGAFTIRARSDNPVRAFDAGYEPARFAT